MKWCRCPKCNHKLFMYEDVEKSSKVEINIKCSSCKRILDVLILNGGVEVKEHGREDSGTVET